MPEMVRVGPAWVQLELIEGEEGHCGLLAVSAVSAEEGLLQLYVQLPEGLLSIYSGFVTRHGGAQDTSLAKAWRGTRYDLRGRFVLTPPNPTPLFERPEEGF